jgi:DNA-directed RNA polymerase II subunit RPB2
MGPKKRKPVDTAADEANDSLKKQKTIGDFFTVEDAQGIAEDMQKDVFASLGIPNIEDQEKFREAFANIKNKNTGIKDGRPVDVEMFLKPSNPPPTFWSKFKAPQEDPVFEETDVPIWKDHMGEDCIRDTIFGMHEVNPFSQTGIDSFNIFIQQDVPKIINEPEPIKFNLAENLQVSATIESPFFRPPRLRLDDGYEHEVTPHETETRNLTYDSELVINIRQKFIDTTTGRVVEETLIAERKIGRIPVMVGSILCHLTKNGGGGKECVFDTGGYFVVNGKRKAIVSQEKMAINHPYVFKTSAAAASTSWAAGKSEDKDDEGAGAEKDKPEGNENGEKGEGFSKDPSAKDLSKKEKLKLSGGNGKKVVITCEVRALSEAKIRSTSTVYAFLAESKGGANPSIGLDLPFIFNFTIPLCAIFKLLGVSKLEEMMYYIIGFNPSDPSNSCSKSLLSYVRSVLEHEVFAMELDDLLIWIGKNGTKQPTNEKRQRHVENLFNNEFLPHMGLKRDARTRRAKAFYLGYMVRKMIAVHDKQLSMELFGVELPADDRDHYAFKRIETAGMLMALQFRQIYRMVLRNIHRNLQKDINAGKYISVVDAINHKIFTQRFKYAISTGNWGTAKGGSTQTGVAQVIPTIGTMIGVYSIFRRVNRRLNREGKIAKPRMQHNSTQGIFCPYETPEGDTCGLVLNLANGTIIRVGYKSPEIISMIFDLSSSAKQKLAFDIIEGRPLDASVSYFNITPGTAPEDFMTWTLGATQIFVNGALIAYTHDPEELTAQLKGLRRAQVLPFTVTVAHLKRLRQVHVNSDSGCIMRPLFNVSRLHKLKEVYQTWKETPGATRPQLYNLLIEHGILEYICKLEESTCRVATFPFELPEPVWKPCEAWTEEEVETMLADQEDDPFTHVQIHPWLQMGLCAGLIPFSDCNQGPRNSYEAGMIKQIMGVLSTNYLFRFEKEMNVLDYPQKPLCATWGEELLNMHEMPGGINAVVAIGTFSGYNIEDAIILNESAVDRGMFRSSSLKTYRDEEKRGVDVQRFEKPDEMTFGLKKANYDKVDKEDGFVAPGVMVRDGDVIIAKTGDSAPLGKRAKSEPGVANTGGKENEKEGKDGAQANQPLRAGTFAPEKRDQSTMLKTGQQCARVEAVAVSCNREGSRFVKMMTRTICIPEKGDKFATRSAQKGVVGLLVREEDMPFTEDGIRPDIIINPHAISSRMTWGHMKEAFASVLGAMAGKQIDATPFRGMSKEAIAERLHKDFGMQKWCNRRMYSGTHGHMLEEDMFVGLNYYNKLKHKVDDKWHARGRGTMHILTRQPIEGRSRNGALRFGGKFFIFKIQRG